MVGYHSWLQKRWRRCTFIRGANGRPGPDTRVACRSAPPTILDLNLIRELCQHGRDHGASSDSTSARTIENLRVPYEKQACSNQSCDSSSRGRAQLVAKLSSASIMDMSGGVIDVLPSHAMHRGRMNGDEPVLSVAKYQRKCEC